MHSLCDIVMNCLFFTWRNRRYTTPARLICPSVCLSVRPSVDTETQFCLSVCCLSIHACRLGIEVNCESKILQNKVHKQKETQ